MTLRQERPRAESGPGQGTRSGVATSTQVSTVRFSNARTRIVGDRTGMLADAVVTVVRAARGVRSFVSRLSARVAAVITPLGWCMLAVVPGASAAGYAFGWVELVAVAFAGLILLAVAGLYLIGRSAIRVELSVAHAHVVVGQQAMGIVVVTNPTRRRTLGSRMEIPVGEDAIGFAVPGLSQGARYRHEFPMPTSRRGIFPVGPVRSIRADPVGMVRRVLLWTGQSQLIVHPRTVPLPSVSTGRIRDLEGRPTRDLSNSDVAFHALREYVAGDDRRYIHWKSTAKTGTHMVRQFEETRRSRLVVALSLAAEHYADPAEFEMAVSAAASLGLRGIRDARDVAVVVGGTTPAFASKRVLGIRQLNSLSRGRLLDDLAGVEIAESSLAIQDLARVASEKVTDISVAYLVCGSRSTPKDLRAASVQFPIGVEVVAVVCDPDSVPGYRSIAGLSVLTIGSLDELQRSLARVSAT
ncbi:MAG: hypothetical protein JWL94_216 [Microbacteriaceae bacterium]|nr:hypothetical protein [Microbacteriaceae bacterium]